MHLCNATKPAQTPNELQCTPPTANIFDVSQGRDGQFEERLVEVLAAHKATFIDNHGDEDIVAFMSTFHDSYSLLHFQNDFGEYLAKDSDDDLFAERFFNRMLDKLDGRPCLLSQCRCAVRNARYTFDAAQIYGAGITASEIAYHQIIDSVHVHCLHSFDRYRLLQKEKETVSDGDGQLTQIAQKKVDDYDRQILASFVSRT